MEKKEHAAREWSISDEDLLEAMRDIDGYLDITLEDFRELYRHAVDHARKRLLNRTLVKEIMTSAVTAVTPEASFATVIQAMASASISGMPVVDSAGKVVGVVSEKDIFARLAGDPAASFWKVLGNCLHCNRCLMRSISDRSAADIMTSPVTTVGGEATIQAAYQIMVDRGVNRLPVVDGEGRLVGIVTRSDLLRAGLLLAERG